MKTYTPEGIAAFESESGARIPARLASFLMTHGAGVYGEIEIHALEEIYPTYAPFFEDPSWVFSSYIPFAANNYTQDIWVLDVATEDVKFARIGHETVPDDWHEEAWAPFSGHADSEFESLGL